MTASATIVNVLAMTALSSLAFAGQPPRQPNAAELGRRVARLGVVGRVLYVAAHPDDENTRLLAWLANEKLVRAAYLSITRGDGGQNLIGSEQGVALGVIRTQELLAARRLDGAEQFFTRARDFGYSKTPEETLAIWGHDEVLADVVTVIRTFRPDVIITRFPSKGMETHGHHTASAILAEEAFVKAADKSYRPEEVAKLGVWQAKRIVQNKPFFGGPKPTDDVSQFVAMDTGTYDPALGLSMGELAADSRSMHKSQGFGVPRSRGEQKEYFQLIAGEPFKTSFLDGVDTSLGRLPSVTFELRQDFNILNTWISGQMTPHPEGLTQKLAPLHAKLLPLPESPERSQKMAEAAELMVACHALHLDATAADHVATTGGKLSVVVNALNRSGVWTKLVAIHFSDGSSAPVGALLEGNKPFTLTREVSITADAPLANPYWLDEKPTPGLFKLADQALIGLPERPPSLWVDFDVEVQHTTFTVRRQVFFQWTDPVAGERYRSVEILPPITVNPDLSVMPFGDSKPRELKVRLKSSIENATGELHLESPEGWKVAPATQPFSLSAKGAETELSFTVTPPAKTSSGTLKAVAIVAGISGVACNRSLVRIEYPHIPIQTMLPLAEVSLVRFDLSRGRTRIGYIPGAGDEVPAALRQVGYDVTILDGESLRSAPLDKYEAILIGVRAFNVNARLPFIHNRLMDYVAKGGTLIAQYNTNNRLAKLAAEIGPLPFAISQDRVTDERAKVTMAAHDILMSPNKITEEDWSGWVQERGLYFADSWDPKYETPLTMNDPNEKPKQGSLLIAKHGKGAFIYTGLAFFRQLPAGVPGAFRLLANLIAFDPSHVGRRK